MCATMKQTTLRLVLAGSVALFLLLLWASFPNGPQQVPYGANLVEREPACASTEPELLNAQALQEELQEQLRHLATRQLEAEQQQLESQQVLMSSCPALSHEQDYPEGERTADEVAYDELWEETASTLQRLAPGLHIPVDACPGGLPCLKGDVVLVHQGRCGSTVLMSALGFLKDTEFPWTFPHLPEVCFGLARVLWLCC